MIDRDNPDFKAGEQMYKDGVKYNSPLLKNATYHRGWTFQEKESRVGYLWQPWNRSGGYKTSADLRTMFT